MSLPLYELPAKDADTTMERLTEDAARKAAASLGFPYFIGLSDGISLAAVVRHPQNPLKSLCGVYLQIRKSGGFYIGQTRNLLQRQYDYTASGIEIDWLAFQPVPLKRLTQAEHEKIQRAIHAGFPLVNRQHAAWSVPRHPDETFDHLFPPEDQDAFIAQGQHHGTTRAERLQAVESAAPPAHRDGWEWFSGLNKAAEMLRAAGAVIHAAIPERNLFSISIGCSLLGVRPRRTAVCSFFLFIAACAQFLNAKPRIAARMRFSARLNLRDSSLLPRMHAESSCPNATNGHPGR